MEGGILTRVSQPDWERLFRIDLSGGEGEVCLVVELMPRRANVLLLRDGVILDCLNRVGPDDNRYRLSLPNHVYAPPPPMKGKLNPAHLTTEDIERILAAAEKPSIQTRRLLPGRILGVSPLMAREVVFRASGDAHCRVKDTDASSLCIELKSLLAPLLSRKWQPGVCIDDGVATGFSVFPVSFQGWESGESISDVISKFHGATKGADAYDEAKKPVYQALEDARARLKGKLASLKSGLKDESELERLRQSGELILAYQYSLAAGQASMEAQYDPAQPSLRIALDPALSPLENAQAYFRKYEKAKSARGAVPALVAETQVELDFLSQLQNDLSVATNWPEIDEVKQHLQARSHWRGKPTKRIGGGGGPLRVVNRDGFVIWIGRNSRQNEKVTFKTANSNDIWLHARGVAGAHVIVRNDGRRISDELLMEAAAVAAHYSQRRRDGSVPVDYTRVKHVKSIKGAGPGMVTYRNEQTLIVKPQDESILE